MKQISTWAKHHVVSSRLIIILSHIILAVIAIYWAIQSSNAGFNVKEGWLYALILFYLTLYFIYPTARNKTFLNNSYYVRVSLHFVMVLCGLSLLFSYHNIKMQTPLNGSAFAAVSIKLDKGNGYHNPEAERLINSYKKGAIQKFNRADRKVLREELKYQIHQYKETKNGAKKGDDSTGLIILTIVVAILLVFVVGSLSCSLSCAGNDGAAILVLVVGLAAIIFGMVMILKGINNKRNRTTEPKTKQPA